MAEQTHKQATLLGLPTELRLQILEEAIAVRRTVPELPSASQSWLKYSPTSQHNSLFLPNANGEDPDQAKSAQPSLLATNRQIREETQYIVGRVSGDPYKLDVMYLGQYTLAASWVSRPCLVKRVAKLDIRIRCFYTPNSLLAYDHNHNGYIWYQNMRNPMALLVSFVLQACWLYRILDVDFVDTRSSSEGGVAMRITRGPYYNKWCAIDNITITIESTNTSMKPQHLNGGNLLEWNSYWARSCGGNLFDRI